MLHYIVYLQRARLKRGSLGGSVGAQEIVGSIPAVSGTFQFLVKECTQVLVYHLED